VRILIADDDPVSCRVLEAILIEWGYDVIIAQDGDEAWKILQAPGGPHLAILDWMMPGMDGIEICRRLRQQQDRIYVYILILTVKDRPEDLVEGMESGADDYLAKPFDPAELKVRLRAGRRILELQDALLSTQEVLRAQATHDPLTGIWNRTEILKILQQEMDRGRREEFPVSLLMADLDGFKRINDELGHLVGDAVLREAAQRMRAAVRSYDEIGRYGGEEFLVVLPGCDAGGALKLAKRIRDRVGGRPMDTSGGLVPITISLGVVTSTQEPDASVERFIELADQALYRAKARGKDRVELASFARKSRWG
jgi:diguanylate cyclase (GGDEF)-like protein